MEHLENHAGSPSPDTIIPPALASIEPAEIDWKPFDAFPPEARLAIIFGQPSEAELYLIRVLLPHGIRLMPHRHPEDRIYTVMSGTFCIGVGEQFDPDAMTAYPPGSVVFLPGGTWHFHLAKYGDYITQVMGVGPLGIEYRTPGSDPRSNSSVAKVPVE
jgi:quercetin dioxygenase-like cupin family protein